MVRPHKKNWRKQMVKRHYRLELHWRNERPRPRNEIDEAMEKRGLEDGGWNNKEEWRIWLR